MEEREGLVVTFKDSQGASRVREGDFLIGSVGDGTRIRFGAVYDANVIDPERAKEWEYLMRDLMAPRRSSDQSARDLKM